MSIVRIDPEGRRNAEHIAIIVVVDLVPTQSHFRSTRPQARGMTATGPAIMEVDPGSVAGTAVDRFLDEQRATSSEQQVTIDSMTKISARAPKTAKQARRNARSD